MILSCVNVDSDRKAVVQIVVLNSRKKTTSIKGFE